MPRKPRSFRAEAIVLKHNDYGEADRMLTIYTRKKGKLRALAHGVRKVRSRKAGHLEPFTRVVLQLAVGRNWHIVTQAEAQDTFPRLRTDLEMLGYASYAVELLDKFTLEEEEQLPLFRLLSQTLSRLNKGKDPLTTLRYYEIRLLDQLGFRPELQNCVVSEQEIQPENQFFSAALGGIVSPDSTQGVDGLVPVSMSALKYLRHFQRSRYSDSIRVKIKPEIHNEMEVLMQHYITYILERGLNSPGFIRRVREENNNG